ncbi:MAG: HD-GYP domain-containing protein [Eubacterium sp.]|nr:HD-GYP domain-containing protein [Eubacterium sp.]
MISEFTGVLTALANICIIFMVVFFRKLGFFTSLILLLIQIPVLMIGFFGHHNASTVSGFFANFVTIVAVVVIYRRNLRIERFQEKEFEYMESRHEGMRRLFEQTATALVNAIDAKDTYSHGHSIRVAEYARMIAEQMGFNQEECERVYYAGLLHDVGKIGIPNSIINKSGTLTEEEYEIIKQHPEKGYQILSSITEYPFLNIGAHYHHERYDGKGYPDRLKGEDIPEIARIISVADAYDAMSSNRSYRAAIPQQLVREEIVKGSGTQFDPRIAKIMQHLIDLDTEYQMREKERVDAFFGGMDFRITEHRSEISTGIVVTNMLTTIRMSVSLTGKKDKFGRGASLVLFDALDGRFHDTPRLVKDLCYFEYCEVWLDGTVEGHGIRKAQTVPETRTQRLESDISFVITMVKIRDHVRIIIDDGTQKTDITIALPDSTRFVYAGLTGEWCYLRDVRVIKDDKPLPERFIPRIAEEISFIDVPEGDIPNVQIDGYRQDASVGVRVRDGLSITFHTMSLPTARLVWHCPYVVVYSSRDGKVNGEDYVEYNLIRFDGETWDDEGPADNELIVKRIGDFEDWEWWKEKNKIGYDSTISVAKEGNIITITTTNLGISITSKTTVPETDDDLYVALTGDQCALTNIRIK